MICRENKQLIDKYLQLRSMEVGEKSLKLDESHLLLLLRFADNVPLYELPDLDQSFGEYLKTPEARRDSKNEPHSRVYRRKALLRARDFFMWAKDEKEEFKGVSIRWIKTLKAKKTSSEDEIVTEYYLLDEILQLAQTHPATLNEFRILAAILFMYFSGMRIGAFLTLPILGVDMQNLVIKQWPSLGVQTKNGKKAKTTLLQIPEYPELAAIILEWDKKVRTLMPPTGMWFAPLNSFGRELKPDGYVSKNRISGFRKDLIAFTKKAGVAYKSSHKLRHGNIRYLKDRAYDMRGLESIAKNSMHTLETLLRYYGHLGEEDTHAEIQKLCARKPTETHTLNLKHDQQIIRSEMKQVLEDVLPRMLEQILADLGRR